MLLLTLTLIVQSLNMLGLTVLGLWGNQIDGQTDERTDIQDGRI